MKAKTGTTVLNQMQQERKALIAKQAEVRKALHQARVDYDAERKTAWDAYQKALEDAKVKFEATVAEVTK